MAIPELDLKKVNLQAAVGYLISLHDNEVDWNLLGIKVIGAIDALPIPAGTYEYGDAYMVGTETPYDMYIYTRPDGNVHTEGYWFPIGKFPAPGPQGPKGDGLEQIVDMNTRQTDSLNYSSTDGGSVTSNATLKYKDSTTGETKAQKFSMFYKVPIVPGKYISMDATSDDKKIEVKVDDTALALDYWKINKTIDSAVPLYQNGKTDVIRAVSAAQISTLARRDANGDCSFHKLNFEFIGFKDGGSEIDYFSIYMNTVGSDYNIDKTPTDTGTLTNTQLVVLQHTDQSKNLRIVYDNQVYYRMDPQSAPNGTLNYIHIDSIDDGNGGYKATGKCFSITVSTRAWQVVDLDFGGSTRTTHNLTLTNSSTGTNIYFSLTNNRPETYEGASAGLLEALGNSQIACTVDANGTYSAGMITTDGTNFQATYGNGEQILIEQMQVSITDNMV